MAQVRLCVNFRVKPGEARRYAATWSSHREKALADPGCLQYELFTSSSDPDKMVLLELWRTRADFDEHWTRELQRTPQGGDLRDRDTPTVAEIYWDRAQYRWDGTAGAWSRVEPTTNASL